MKRRRLRATAGFTLVELMVALVISGFVIGAMYSIGSASSRHFQVQHQVASMQSALRFAMIQVKRDIMRAGYLAAPVALNRCGAGAPSSNVRFGGDGWVAGVSSFRNNNDLGANLVDPTGNNAANGFSHDEITLIGNYATSNEYQGVTMVGQNRLQLTIDPADISLGLLSDFGWDNGGVASLIVDQNRIQQVFPVNGLIRLRTKSGEYHFATLTGPALINGTNLDITFTPGITEAACLADMDDGWVSPLQIVRYGAALSAPGTIASDRATDAAIPQLVRTQRLATNKDFVVPNSVSRVVLDYLAAFTLGFTMTAATGPTQPDQYVIGASGSRTFNPVQVNQDPDLIRAIWLTLAVRAPSTDPGMRFFNCGNLQCFQIDREAGVGGPAARVRTLRAEVFLPNIAYEGFR